MLNKFRASPHKLDCHQVEAQVTAYLKGGLSPAQQHAFRSHLLRCESCTRLVQEARAMDAELFESAHLDDRPYLTPEASIRIQERLYRRMRRALFLQRTRQATERMVAFVAVFIVVLSALFVGRPWLRFVATAQNDGTPSTTQVAVAQDAPASDGPSEESHPFSPPATPLPLEELVAAEPTPPTERPDSPDPIASEPADILVRTMIEAAIQGDEAQLRLLLNRARPFNAAGLRVWQRLENCQGQLTADDFTFRTASPHNRLTSVYIFYNNQFLGDMKYYLDDNSQWYLSYLNYGSFSHFLTSCRPQ